MTPDLTSLRQAIMVQLPVFVRGKLEKFEAAIRADERERIAAERQTEQREVINDTKG